MYLRTCRVGDGVWSIQELQHQRGQWSQHRIHHRPWTWPCVSTACFHWLFTSSTVITSSKLLQWDTGGALKVFLGINACLTSRWGSRDLAYVDNTTAVHSFLFSVCFWSYLLILPAFHFERKEKRVCKLDSQNLSKTCPSAHCIFQCPESARAGGGGG